MVNDGSAYGQFVYDTSVVFSDELTGAETAVMVNASGYGSEQTKLKDDHVVHLNGRFIPQTDIKDCPHPFVHFDQELSLTIGHADDFTSSLANKVGVKGFGVVIERNIVEVVSSSKPKQNNLHVVVRHTDYDPIVSPHIQYHPRRQLLTHDPSEQGQGSL